MATPPWQVTTQPDVAAAEPTADELAKQLALVGKRPVHLGADDLSESDESEPDSEEEERLRPPGPPDPENCMVTCLNSVLWGMPALSVIVRQRNRDQRLWRQCAVAKSFLVVSVGHRAWSVWRRGGLSHVVLRDV